MVYHYPPKAGAYYQQKKKYKAVKLLPIILSTVTLPLRAVPMFRLVGLCDKIQGY